MKTIIDILTDYAVYHTKPKTKYTHIIGVPLIILSLFILFSWLRIGTISVAVIISFSLIAYYLWLDFKLGLITGALLLVLLSIAMWISGNHFSLASLGMFLIFFVGGWFLQLLGHHHEGNKPALVDNFLQVFTAPVFVVAEVLFMLGFCKDLEAKIRKRAANLKK